MSCFLELKLVLTKYNQITYSESYIMFIDPNAW